MPTEQLSATDVLRLQRLVGNRAVGRLTEPGRRAAVVVQREFEDADKVAEDAVGSFVEPAGSPATAVAKATTKSTFGELDGQISSNVQPHAFADGGRTGEGAWIHNGGTGGRGNQPTGDAVLIAPVYKTKPAPPGGLAKAWIQKGTGKIKVTRSYTGVTHGAQGAFTCGIPGAGWMSPRARDRIDKHERQHIKKSKELYGQYIEPLEKRISTYRGFIKAKKKGADEATAQAALQTEIDWNQSVQDFANEDTRENTPMGPVDLIDQAKADFYHHYPTSAGFQATSNCDRYVGVGLSKKKKT